MSSVKQVIAHLRAGEMIIIVDDASRENEGDLVFAAQYVDLQKMQFMLQHTCGIVCLSLHESLFQHMQIPLMTANNCSHQQTPFGISIEATHGVTTGVSAMDRVTTIAAVMNAQSKPTDIVMPGHVFPLQAHSQGVLKRRGHTEASIDLMRLANLSLGAVICELTNKTGSLMRLAELTEFSKQHDIPIIHVKEIVDYCLYHDDWLPMKASAKMPIAEGEWMQIHVYQNSIDEIEHVALVSEEIDLSEPVLVRVHSECLTGDVLHSARCDCGEQLTQAQRCITHEKGVLIYLRQEGRGIGLTNKIRAYALQDQGYDTVEANEQLGFAADQRQYEVAAKILQQLHIHRIRLLTNNPHKQMSLQAMGVDVVERLPLQVSPTAYNKSYLQTKKMKLGHLLEIK